MASYVYTIRWRLLYLDGRQLDELPTGSSLRDRWPNPIALQLMDVTGQSVMHIALPGNAKPVFYRRRSLDFTHTTTNMRLDAIVFGFVFDKGSAVEGKLWLWHHGKAVDCPPEHIDQSAIELALMA